ncbi:MAG: hypothetical protein H7Z39_05685 [Burkholderiaceae bacterium]|nr:hypothetical protein [Burkholderiaceae bacterium]
MALGGDAAWAAEPAGAVVDAPQRRVADFARERASGPARELAGWVLDSGDNGGEPFVIVDKAEAAVFVFDDGGRLLGAGAALLGLARGDDAVPGIGQRALSSILPAERTTPAGRFVASLDRNVHGWPILWVDYDTAISLHSVVTSQRAERRAERLASPTPDDNRISYGCINVAPAFFGKVVVPAFRHSSGIVYVLPETRPAGEVFAALARANARHAVAPAPH